MSSSAMRHMVRPLISFDGFESAAGWECVDCGQTFSEWPPDTAICAPIGRQLPGVLFNGERESINAWRAHGLPLGSDGKVDDSTARAAARIAVRLLDGLDVAWDVIDSLTQRSDA